MSEADCEQPPQEIQEQPKKSRHRKKHLYNTILQQMEFYFSDSNLSKDRFLSQLLAKSPDVDLEVFLKFNKIRKLNCPLEDIQKAIKRSDLIGLSEDELKVHRKKPVKVKENEDFCTIYVENIKSDVTHESLSQIFSEFGKVAYVSIPKYKHNRANKGFAFIEYETEQQANEALTFFQSIGCKMPSDKNPEELQSIATFKEESENVEIEDESQNVMNIQIKEETSIETTSKRKLSTEADENGTEKKQKIDHHCNNEIQKGETSIETTSKRKLSTEAVENGTREKQKTGDQSNNETQKASDAGKGNQTGEDTKKKKKTKKEKRKNLIREMGMKVLSKTDWKKLRNCYLNLQRKKMKEFKQHLCRQKIGPNAYMGDSEEMEEKGDAHTEHKEGIIEEVNKLSYTPGVIVKLTLPEPCIDVKKLKNEIKSVSPEVKYVDIPLPVGSEEVFIRFGTSEAASQFCNTSYEGQKSVLTGEEEKIYWGKIENDRIVKFQKLARKQRGRDKLLKKAEKEYAKHIKFEDIE